MCIIRDPKMNQRERRFGILQKGNVLAAYDKTDKGNDPDIRYLPAGYLVTCDLLGENTADEDFQGIPIKRLAKNVQGKANQGLVTRRLKNLITRFPRFIFTNVESDIGVHRDNSSDPGETPIDSITSAG